MTVGPSRPQQALNSEWSNIAFPSGWRLQAATFSWLEEAGDPRSAEAIFSWLAERAPDVVLKSRVPTHTLPCREFAAGDWLGHGLEVAVMGGDFSVRVALVEKSDASRPFVLATEDALEAMHRLTDRNTSMRQLSLSVSMQGLRPEIAHAKFAAALGLAAPEAGVADQCYRKKMRSLAGSEHDGFLDVMFELATAAGDHDQTHRLDLTSQAQKTSLSASSSREDWSILLGASLTTISSFVV
jgi:hypothetical protein